MKMLVEFVKLLRICFELNNINGNSVSIGNSSYISKNVPRSCVPFTQSNQPITNHFLLLHNDKIDTWAIFSEYVGLNPLFGFVLGLKQIFKGILVPY